MITFNIREKDDKTGPILATYNAESDGSYEFPLDFNHEYMIEIMADGYYTDYFNVSTFEDFSLNQDFVLSKLLDKEVLRVILQWEETPLDLDTHAIGVYKANDIDIHYGNKIYTDPDDNTFEVSTLDVDDTNGKGPETLSVYTKDFEFVYRVTRYSNDRDMTSTRVRVKVYHKDGRQWEFFIDNKNNNAKHWNVFKFVNGDVIPLNEYLNENQINIDTGNPGTKITTVVPDPVTPEPTTTYTNFSDDTLFKQKGGESAWGWQEIQTRSNAAKLKEAYVRVWNALYYNGVLTNDKFVVNTYGTSATSLPVNPKFTHYNADDRLIVLYNTDIDLDINDILEIVTKVIADNPGLMAKGSTYSYGYTDSTRTHISFFSIDYFSESQRQTFLTKCNATFDKIKQKVVDTYGIAYNENAIKSGGYTELQKKRIGKVIHDFLVLNGTYGDINETNWINQTMYPALSEYTCTSYGCAGPVCASYSSAFKWCCWKFGIAAVDVSGSCGNERDGRHAWNIVSYKSNQLFDNTNSNAWQEVDCTWDDPTFSDGVHTDFVSWQHLNITTAEILAGVDGTPRKRYVYGSSANNSWNGTEKDGQYKIFPDNNNGTCNTNKYPYADSYVSGSVKYGGF